MADNFDMKAGGVKADDGKLRIDLIPPEVIFALASVLTFGANKYSDRNWEKGMRWGRVFGALMRHMWAWLGGKGPTTDSFLFGSIDEETKFSHLWHALCCLAFLVAYEERGHGTDDRFDGTFPDDDGDSNAVPTPRTGPLVSSDTGFALAEKMREEQDKKRAEAKDKKRAEAKVKEWDKLIGRVVGYGLPITKTRGDFVFTGDVTQWHLPAGTKMRCVEAHPNSSYFSEGDVYTLAADLAESLRLSSDGPYGIRHAASKFVVAESVA